MEDDTPCGVSTQIISNLGDIHKLMANGQELIAKVEGKVKGFNSLDEQIKDKLKSSSDKLKALFNHYEEVYNELQTYQNNGEKIELLDRMQDNSLFNLNSSKLKYTILNILAVLFIIALFIVFRLKPSASKLSNIKVSSTMPKIPNIVK